MKLIEQINAKVVSIVYDEMKDALIASLNKSVPVPVLYADQIIYERRASMYLELGSVDVTSIDEDDIITIQLFEHYPGEQVELFGGEYHTFATTGYHNFISAIEYHTDEISWDEIEAADIARHTGDPAPTPASGTIGAYVRDKIEEYQIEDIVVDHNADYTYVKVNKIDSSLKAMNFANFVAKAQLVSIRGNEDGSVSCWF